MSKVLKRIWMFLAILIIFTAVLTSIFRSLTPWVKEYKGEVEHQLSILTGQPVTIQTMETGWYWFEPVLKLHHVTLGDDLTHNFSINKLLVGINLFKSLWTWQIKPGVLYIDEMHLDLKEKDHRWSINGIGTDSLTTGDMISEQSKQILMWLSQQEHLIIKHVSAYIHFSNGDLIPVDGLNVSVANKGGHYKFKGEAQLKQTSSTAFQLLGDGYFDPEHFEDIEGKFYFSAKNIVPAQWQSFFPDMKEHFEGGKGKINLWLDVHHGAISSIQAQIALKRLAWKLLNSQQSQLISFFSANLFWKPDSSGWQLHADPIKLRMGELTWPDNKLLIKYNAEQQSYQLYVKLIILESLLSKAISWPKSIQHLLDLHPKGMLRDTQLQFTLKKRFILPPIPLFNSPNFDQPSPDEVVDPTSSISKKPDFSPGDYSINYVLTRFEKIGWMGKAKIPEVTNLSGVVHWQPEQGHMEIDSENTLIKMKGYPEQTLTLLNGVFDWTELSNGLRLSIERLVLRQPEMTLSLQGAVDQLTRDTMGSIRLGAEFSGKNLEQWMVYLPKAYLKPKLYLWLKNDVKHIAEASGKVRLNGLAKDFPFDHNEGEFTIDSFISGGTIAINSKWQVINDMDASLHVKNRNLSVDIVHADIQGVLAKNLHLGIDDIGHDKEILTVEGAINGSVQDMLNYVMHSPLKKKLSLLKIVSIDKFALLTLKTHIPLYPGNNTVLAKGSLDFNNNNITVHHELGQVAIHDLWGGLMFNEKGVTESYLAANILGHPMDIRIQSVKLPKVATLIVINGKWSMDSLKNQFKLPWLSFVDGTIDVSTQFKLGDHSSGADQVTLKSTLEGMQINLPSPLGKKTNVKTPVQLNLALNSKNTLRLRANYDARLGVDLLFQKAQEGYAFHSGQLRLGGAYANPQNVPGLSIVGLLKGFNLQEWKEIYAQFSTEKTGGSALNNLRSIDLTVDKLSFLKQQFNAMKIKAKIIANKTLAFNLQQKNISADLKYNLDSNALSGYVHHLNLNKISAEDSSHESSSLHPKSIPNLNLRIDNLSIGKVQVGNLTLKSHSTAKQLKIDYCQINSPVYQIDLRGDWIQNENRNQSRLDVKLNINHLAKSLERWDVTSVVHAKKGYLEFHGGWNKSLYQFSLASLKGSMYLELKNGRITHLSNEMEEKLGLGKLLSILSLQTIPRRLQLDFSDLAYKGYSFDIFQGNFIVNKGIMRTQDSYLEGPVAFASMKGALNLLKRTYDLDLQISPHITASLPIVATIAGGPIAGIAVWVANNIINHSMQKITAYSYQISGPWSEPVVQQLGMVKKIVKKS